MICFYVQQQLFTRLQYKSNTAGLTLMYCILYLSHFTMFVLRPSSDSLSLCVCAPECFCTRLIIFALIWGLRENS